MSDGNTENTKQRGITHGVNFNIHNSTPFALHKEKQYHYQVECDYPNDINANSEYHLRVEFEVAFVQEKDDEAFGLYSINTEDGKKFIAFCADKKKDNNFNVWVDFCENRGTLKVKENIKRQDFGFILNGTFEFYLFYDENTKQFSINPY